MVVICPVPVKVNDRCHISRPLVWLRHPGDDENGRSVVEIEEAEKGRQEVSFRYVSGKGIVI